MSDARWVWVEIAATVVIPVAVLTFGGSWLSPTAALLVAMGFPTAFALASLAREGRPSALSALSLASVVLTGGIGVWQLDPRWFALKEAAVPVGFGVAIAASSRTRLSVVPVLLDRLLDPERTRAALGDPGRKAAYDEALRRGTLWLGAATALSGAASYGLAAWFVQSPPGTPEFTTELGRYTGWSFPLVTVPTMGLSVWVLRRVIDRVEDATGVPLEELLRSNP